MKKIFVSLMVFCLLFINASAFAGTCCNQCQNQNSCQCCTPEVTMCQEHLCVNKKACVNTVTITNYRKIICAKNVLAVLFECPFCSRKACAGNVINFVIPDALYTEEGTLLLPACTKFVAEITKVQHPKWFNKNARVSIFFRCLILPDGRVVNINARPFSKDCVLMEGPWMTAGKLFLSTITLGILGAGAGVGFGFIPSPTRIWTGLAVGIPVGAGVGLATGLISKGLQYKAKCGEQIFIILTSDASIYN